MAIGEAGTEAWEGTTAAHACSSGSSPRNGGKKNSLAVKPPSPPERTSTESLENANARWTSARYLPGP